MGRRFIYIDEIMSSPSFVSPTITTTAISSIFSTYFTTGGNLTDNGGDVNCVKGVCWNVSTDPTISDSKIQYGTDTGSFSQTITGLTSGVTYYVRAYATNSIGTTYGLTVSGKTVYGLMEITLGGVIGMLWSGNTHGIVFSQDLYTATWGCKGTSITTSTNFGTGQANTNAIIAGCATAGIAARVCDSLSLSGYTDWYLPSLNDIYNAGISGQGFYYPNYHLTSSQQSADFALRCQPQATSGAVDKSVNATFRAARTF